jgi:hypothetical protein
VRRPCGDLELSRAPDSVASADSGEPTLRLCYAPRLDNSRLVFAIPQVCGCDQVAGYCQANCAAHVVSYGNFLSFLSCHATPRLNHDRHSATSAVVDDILGVHLHSTGWTDCDVLHHSPTPTDLLWSECESAMQWTRAITLTIVSIDPARS